MENNRISRLKIAIVTNRFYPEVGGAETNIWFQAKELAKKHDVTIYCPKRIDRPWSEEFDGFRLVRMYDVLHPFCKYPNIATKTLCPSMFFRILFSGFDVIMFFPALNYNNKLAYFASRMRGIPIIGCFFDFIDYAAVIKEKGSVPDDILGQTLVKDTDARILRGLDHIYAIADKEIAFLQKFNGHVEYSPVPVLMDEYLKESPSCRSKYGISDNEFVFLCLGRVSQIKGQDIAVKAFCSTFRDRKDARLVIVGRHDYEPGFTDAMKKEIASAGMDGRVIFTGMVERPEVLGWLRHSDIHVIPVRFMNSGAVVVETWASGTPVIQSDVVDPNLVADGLNGFLFKKGSVENLAEKMDEAYARKGELKRMAGEGAKLVREKYTYEYLIGLYEKAFGRLVKNAHKEERP